MRFSLGINYWPRRSAMAMWRRFDPGEIREDFARIAELGLDAVRFFLRWDDFQPQPDTIDAAMLGAARSGRRHCRRGRLAHDADALLRTYERGQLAPGVGARPGDAARPLSHDLRRARIAVRDRRLLYRRAARRATALRPRRRRAIARAPGRVRLGPRQRVQQHARTCERAGRGGMEPAAHRRAAASVPEFR